MRARVRLSLNKFRRTQTTRSEMNWGPRSARIDVHCSRSEYLRSYRNFEFRATTTTETTASETIKLFRHLFPSPHRRVPTCARMHRNCRRIGRCSNVKHNEAENYFRHVGNGSGVWKFGKSARHTLTQTHSERPRVRYPLS